MLYFLQPKEQNLSKSDVYTEANPPKTLLSDRHVFDKIKKRNHDKSWFRHDFVMISWFRHGLDALGGEDQGKPGMTGERPGKQKHTHTQKGGNNK